MQVEVIKYHHASISITSSQKGSRQLLNHIYLRYLLKTVHNVYNLNIDKHRPIGFCLFCHLFYPPLASALSPPGSISSRQGILQCI